MAFQRHKQPTAISRAQNKMTNLKCIHLITIVMVYINKPAKNLQHVVKSQHEYNHTVEICCTLRLPMTTFDSLCLLGYLHRDSSVVLS